LTGALDILRRVEALRAPFGFERSVKLVDGALYDDRCLMSLHRSALGPAPCRLLTQMVSKFGAPDPVCLALHEALRGAEVVHIGHESEDGAAVRKLYFEYVSRARAAMARGEPVLVHLAYKWAMNGDHATAVTRYVWRPCPTLRDAEARVAERLPQTRAPRARATALALLDKAAALANNGELNMLDVEEPGNPRQSLDMNLYDAGLTIAGVETLLARAGEAFSIAPARLDAAFQRDRAAALGHLGAGIDRRGREFVTFYFGVEARGE